jgi:hypothetical protein
MFSKRSESRAATVMGVIYNEFEMNGKRDETTPAARDPLRGEGQANGWAMESGTVDGATSAKSKAGIWHLGEDGRVHLHFPLRS